MEDRKKLILHAVDHTILSPAATWEEVRRVCDEAILYETASICIPPAFVKRAKQYVGNCIPIGTVIGFPNGYTTTSTKMFETDDVLKKGADEIDMVINLGDLKDGRWKCIENEIRIMRLLCEERILKVIIEACLLTEEEKIRMCGIVSELGADYIKTSTGFSSGGATAEDVRLLASHVGPGIRVKAAGGIDSFEKAEALLQAGALRLGSSRLVRLAKEEESDA